MDNFSKSANQLWKESNTSLSFKDWLDREKEKGKFHLPYINSKFIFPVMVVLTFVLIEWKFPDFFSNLFIVDM